MPIVSSGRALADALGVSETAVRKALKRGKIPRETGGGFDVERCRAAWEAKTDPARTKVRSDANQGAQSAPEGPHPVVRTEADARDAIALIARVLKTEGAEAGPVDYNAARTAETILKAYERDLGLKLRRGELVEIEAVGVEVEQLFSVVRSRLIGIPGKLAAKLVGLDLPEIRLAIENEINEALSELHAPAVEAAVSSPPNRGRR